MRRNFTLILIGILGLVSIGVFVTFSYFARTGFHERRDISRANLITMARALKTYALDNNNQFPYDPHVLTDKYGCDGNTFINPSWPDACGYMYVSGFNPMIESTGTTLWQDTILLFENVPESKQKLGRLVATLDGEIHLWHEELFQKRLAQQKNLSETQGRRWRIVALIASKGEMIDDQH